MKATTVFVLLFMFAFVFAASFATGGEPCLRSQCICQLYCSNYAGPSCKLQPINKYYLYEINCEMIPGENCMGCDDFDWGFVGCCRKFF